jgi:hypothetical protein
MLLLNKKSQANYKTDSKHHIAEKRHQNDLGFSIGFLSLRQSVKDNLPGSKTPRPA